MEAVAWTAIGLLATSMFGSFFYLGHKIDALGSGLNARIDGLGSGLNARIDALGARLDARIDQLSARLDDHTRHHAG